MIEEISTYLDKFDEQTRQKFYVLHKLIHESTTQKIQEKLWAKLPSYYVENNFVRVIPFKNHTNIEAKAVLSHRDELYEYKITPKGMLQIFHQQQIPSALLKIIFKESLE